LDLQLAWGNDLGRCIPGICGAEGAARTSVPRAEAEKRVSETIKQALSLLDQTLQQEKKTDFDVTKIAETAVNAEAE
jgi:hypothetical protein